MLTRLFGHNLPRRYALNHTAPSPLHDYLSAPFPARGSDCDEVNFIALDLETTGLDPVRDEILSIGMVGLHGLRVDLATASHSLVTPTTAIPEQSAVIHQITDDQAAQGRPIREVMAEVLPQLAGKVMIAHHARIELSFFEQACQRLYGGHFLIPVVDTEWLARRARQRRDQPITPGELRLAALREHYNLPRYPAHNALSDAVATAELFIAQAVHSQLKGRRSLSNYLSYNS